MRSASVCRFERLISRKRRDELDRPYDFVCPAYGLGVPARVEDELLATSDDAELRVLSFAFPALWVSMKC
jgi:hypothetical protein